jgi:hypothetical protein
VTDSQTGALLDVALTAIRELQERVAALEMLSGRDTTPQEALAAAGKAIRERYGAAGTIMTGQINCALEAAAPHIIRMAAATPTGRTEG